MIFDFLSSKKTVRRKAALSLYDTIVNAARSPGLYAGGRVPDTIDGRFEMLCLFTALVMIRLKDTATADNAALSQALFDVFFVDMDRSARERGVGDLAVPHHIKRMMTTFNGRLHGYRQTTCHDFLKRTVYAASPDTPDGAVSFLAARIDECRAALALWSPPSTLSFPDLTHEPQKQYA